MYRACHASGISISRVEVEQKHARLHCCLTSSNGMMAGGAESHTPRRYSRWHVTLAENQQSFSNLGFWFTAKQFYLMLFFPWFLPPSICENYTVLPIWPLHHNSPVFTKKNNKHTTNIVCSSHDSFQPCTWCTPCQSWSGDVESHTQQYSQWHVNLQGPYQTVQTKALIHGQLIQPCDSISFKQPHSLFAVLLNQFWTINWFIPTYAPMRGHSLSLASPWTITIPLITFSFLFSL